jgi:ribosomal protein S18 acetylase RimI-like enzyme
MIAREYADSSRLQLYGYKEDLEIVAVVGLEQIDEHAAVIRDLAVAPTHRLRGIGRALVDYLRRELGFASLEGATLKPAVSFYRRCGFMVREDGRVPDGETRYRFTWARERRL